MRPLELKSPSTLPATSMKSTRSSRYASKAPRCKRQSVTWKEPTDSLWAT